MNYYNYILEDLKWRAFRRAIQYLKATVTDKYNYFIIFDISKLLFMNVSK